MTEIYLNNLRISDWAALRKIASHPSFFYRALNDQNAWVAWRAARYVFKANIAWLLNRNVKAIRIKPSNELIGCVLFTDLDKKVFDAVEVGYFIAAPYQGQQVGTAAVLRFVEWGVQNLGVKSIQATANPNNVPSVRILQKIGLTEIGHISADQKKYFDRDGIAEPRVVMRGEIASIEAALIAARNNGIYSPSMSIGD